MAKAKYLSLLALSALLVGCGPSTSAPTTSVEEPSSEPTTSEVPTTAPTSDPTVPPFVGPSSVGLIGSMAESDWSTDIPLTVDSEGKVWTLSDYPFSAGDEWKLRADGAWDWQWSFDNLDEASAALFENAGGYGNVKVLTSAYYSISVNAETDVVTVVKGEDILPNVPEGPSWPTEEFQALVYEATGSEVVVPAYEGASAYEMVPDYASLMGIAVIYCTTDAADPVSDYTETLLAANWHVEEIEGGIGAIDPSEELILEASYDPEYSSLDIYVGAYSPLPTEWPTEDVQALVYEATGSEVVVPAYEDADSYELDDSGLEYGEAYIYCYTDDADSVSAYEEVLVAAGWELFVDEEFYGTCAVDPTGELVVSYAYSEEYASLDLCVFAYEVPGEDGGETEVTPESVLYDFLNSIGLSEGKVTVDGDDAYFAYKITNFDSIQELCEVATYNAPTYLTLAIEPTQDQLTTGGECWYSVLTTEDNSIAVEVLTYWASATEPVLQVSAYYL